MAHIGTFLQTKITTKLSITDVTGIDFPGINDVTDITDVTGINDVTGITDVTGINDVTGITDIAGITETTDSSVAPKTSHLLQHYQNHRFL